METATACTQLFGASQPFIQSNPRLREPQYDAYEAVRQHYCHSTDPAVVQIPVGGGKTGLISILPFGIADGRVLIVAPNLTIREALYQAVDSASPNCFWRAMNVAPLTPEGPFAAKIDGPDANLADCANSHFVVTNVQQISQSRSRWLHRLPQDFFDMIIFDEGHHNAAASWRRLIEHFPFAKVISLTATPFRSDGQELIGCPIYQYPFLRAMARGYIKYLRSIHVAPEELSFTFKDSSQCCSLEEVLRLSEEVWFSRGVALSEACNRHIVAASLDQCEALRKSGRQKHQIIAATCSVDHARQVAGLYRDAGYKADEIHSLQSKQKQSHVLSQLRQGKLDVVVQVQMLGEGFDHPPLSVAAVFRPFRTLSPYIQFVGRIMRVNRQQAPGDPDNQGVVVSHVGLNTDRHWQQFQQLDTADQMLWKGLATGADASQNSDRKNNQDPIQPREFKPDMLVDWEVIGELKSSGYEKELTVEQLPLELASRDQTSRAIAGPQQRRREARDRLKEQANFTIRQILGQSQLNPLGWQVGRKFAFLRRQNNWAAIRFWLYSDLNRRLKRRSGSAKEWSLDEVEQAIDLMPEIAQEMRIKLDRCFPRRESCPRSAGY